MHINQLLESIPVVTPHMYLAKQGALWKALSTNDTGMGITSPLVRAAPVKRMWMRNGRVYASVGESNVVNVSDGYSILSNDQAYEVYQLTNGVMKGLADDAASSANHIRDILDMDS